jgi:hypothetical protein
VRLTGCPSSVVVGPHTYTIVIDADEAQRERVTHANVDCVYTRIVVNPAQSATQLRDSVVHELLHAIMHNTGLTGYDDAPLDDSLAERVARALSPAVYDLLQRNSALVDWLTERAT